MSGTKLYVGNLSYSVTDVQLRDLFSNHGEVKEVTLLAGKGFGFVSMSNADEALKAKEALNGTQWEGRTIKVDEARPFSPNNERRAPQFRGRSDRGSRGRGYRR